MAKFWIQRVAEKIGPRRMLKLLSYYPPYLGAGVKVVDAADDGTWVTVEMGLTPWNRNFFGTQFGGSLYSMCDPFFLFLVHQQLGDGYVVWDKAAQIRFRKPGRGTVRAHFSLPKDEAQELRAKADRSEKVEPVFKVEVRDEAGEVIAELEKTLYVRRKPGLERT